MRVPWSSISLIIFCNFILFARSTRADPSIDMHASTASCMGMGNPISFDLHRQQVLPAPLPQGVPTSSPLPHAVPTRFSFMPVRFVLTQQAVAGYEHTGISLVGFNGTKFVPAGVTDDIGLYYVIPKAKTYLHLSTEQSLDLMVLCLIFVPTLSGIIGLYLLIRSKLYRLVAIVALCCVAIISARFGDIYVIQSGIAVGLVPWILYFARRGALDISFYVVLFIVGLTSVAANTLRLHAGTPVLVFTVIVLLFQVKTSVLSRLSLIVTLAIGGLVPQLYFQKVLQNRDRFLLAADGNYIPVVARHPFWHNIYAGLGFLNNDYGLMLRDEVAIEKVRTMDPHAQYPSLAYERVVRKAVFDMIKTHPGFVLFSFAAKFGVLLVILIICSNHGLIAAARCPKPWPIECAFWSALSIASLNGVLVAPNPAYLLGFVALCVLYGIVSLEWKKDRRDAYAVAKHDSVSAFRDGTPIANGGAASGHVSDRHPLPSA